MADPVADLPRDRQEAARREAPLSFAQERLWFLDQLDPGNTAFNIPSGYRVTGPLDAPALAAALEGLVERHEALRTVFERRGDRPVQGVLDPAAWRRSLGGPSSSILPVVDLAGLPETAARTAAREVTERVAGGSFDLAAGPLLRACLVRLAVPGAPGNGAGEAAEGDGGEAVHLLQLVFHHIVSDGWSMGVVLQELAALYQGRLHDRPAGLPALPIQYPEYARRQRRALDGDGLEDQLAYWMERLVPPPEPLELPTAGPRPPWVGARGGQVRKRLGREATGRLRQLSHRLGATLFMGALAAFDSLLLRVTDQTDLAVGSPIAGRTDRQIEGLIGFFLNTLVLRTDLSGDPPFEEALARVRDTTLGAFGNAEIPIERLIEAIQPERDLSHPPLFQVMFNLLDLQGVQKGPVVLEGLTFELLELTEVETKFDLTVYAGEVGGELSLGWVYAAELFDPPTMERLSGQMVTLLEGAVEDPSRPLSALPLLRAEERAQLERRRGPSPGTSPDRPFEPWSEADLDQTLGERFTAVAAAGPERPALVSRRHRWSYGELDRRARAVTARLAESLAGASGASPVALLVKHDAPMVAALLGVSRHGRPYVPLDPRFPEERLGMILAECRADALVFDPENRQLAETLLAGAGGQGGPRGARGPRLVELPGAVTAVSAVSAVSGVSPGSAAGEGAGEAPNPGSTPAETAPDRTAPDKTAPDRTAYILFTSGSSGRPKGVVQSHRNVLHHIRAYTNALHLGPEDRLTLLASYGFDASVMDLWGALLNGGCLVLADLKAEGFDGLAERFAAEAVTVYHSTPTVYRYFLESLEPGRTLPDLRLVVLGGEEARRSDWERFREITRPGALLVNGLGPTESTLALQRFYGHGDAGHGEGGDRQGRGHEAGGDDDGVPNRSTLAVGWPVEATRVRLMAEAGEQLAFYGVGEIVLSSPHVAKGYWRRPDLTRQAFAADPEQPGWRTYRTGDLGRLLPDGAIEFAGRKDHQVKIRGIRVEIPEVEARLRALPEVAEGVVVDRQDPRGERRLVAYWVPAASAPGGPDGNPDEAPDGAAEERETSDRERALALRRRLAESLPDAMIPSLFQVVEALPTTPTGKIDRRALPEPVWTVEEEGGAEHIPPRTATERVIAALWSELLRVPRVGARDDFFGLGGHSLLATRAVVRLRRELGVEVPLRTLFEATTVEALGAALDGEIARLGGPGDGDRGAPAGEEAARRALELEGPTARLREPWEPLSFAQERVWFIQRLAPESFEYNLPAPLGLVGALDRPALARAFTRVVGRHEVLRTRYREVAGEPRQVVDPPAPVPLPLVDLSALGPERRRREARALAAAQATRPFDLARGPVLRVLLVGLGRRGDGRPEHALLPVVHHIAADGWSVGLLMAEVAALYRALAEGGEAGPQGEPVLAPLPIQYADHACWERAWLTGPVLEGEVEHWRRALEGATPLLPLPTDRPRPPVQRHRGGLVRRTLSPEVAAGLARLARESGDGSGGPSGGTLFMALLAVLAVDLLRWTGESDLPVGTPVAGRLHAQTEPLVGFFANTLVLRVEADPAGSFRDLLARVRRVTVDAQAHQRVPFERLVEALDPVRTLGASPLFQVMLILQNAFEQAASVTGLAAGGGPAGAVGAAGPGFGDLELAPLASADPGELAGGTGAEKFDLTLVAQELPGPEGAGTAGSGGAGSGGGLALLASYDRDLFDAATLERFLARFELLAKAVIDAPDRSLETLPVLAEGERGQLLGSWSGAPVAVPRQALVPEERSGEAASTPPPADLPGLFRARAERTPEALALVAPAGGADGEPRPWTYGDLERASALLAARLVQAGVGPEVRVGVALDRSAELVVALLAVLRAGGAYVALDPSYPAERVAFQMVDGRVAVRLTRGDLVEALPPLPDGTTQVLVDGVMAHGASGDEGGEGLPEAWREVIDRFEIDQPWAAERLAYVLYTSGSTGVPKGVAIPHRSAVALVAWALATFPEEATRHLLASTSVSFDLSVFELFVPLARGAAVHLARTALDLPHRRDAGEITFLNTVPSAAAELLAGAADGTAPLPEGLRVVGLAGEALPGSLVRELRARLAGSPGGPPEVWNLYGPSEDTTYSTAGRVEPGDAAPTIGRPVAGTRAYVADRLLALVPRGSEGELLLGGAGLARGYLGRPAWTAERFVPDPFGGGDGERLYRTGDRVRWTAAGEAAGEGGDRPGRLEFLGRLDRQVKLRGFRIELGEIAAVLTEHPGVAEAAVEVIRPSGAGISAAAPGDGRLVAFVVPEGGAAGAAGDPLGAPALQGRLRQRLPEPMVPRDFVTLEALPRTPNGKLDRRALGALFEERAGAARGPEAPDGGEVAAADAPRGATEELVAAVWSRVLERPAIGRRDDFFALGGHSLLATRVFARLSTALGVELPLAALFEAPTLAAFAERLDRAVEAARAGEEGAGEGEGVERPPRELVQPLAPAPWGVDLPLSYEQERLWVVDRLQPGLAAYNLPLAVELLGPLEPAVLARALGEVVARHAVLRTRFVERGGRPLQVVEPVGSPGAHLPLPVVDLSALPETGGPSTAEVSEAGEASAGPRQRAAAGALRELARRPFDLERAPLLRALLVRLDGAAPAGLPDAAGARHALGISMHHTVSDGWSLGLLMGELVALYPAFSRGRPSPLPPLPLQYADVAYWQRQWLRGEVLERLLDAWRERLAGLPPVLDLPTDRPRPEVVSLRGDAVALAVPPGLGEAVDRLARPAGATRFMALTAAFQALLARWSGQDDIPLGTVMAQRQREELDALIGFFVNTLVLRGDLSSAAEGETGPAPLETPAPLDTHGLLERTRRTMLHALAHQSLPFEVLVAELAPERSLSTSPLFQVAIADQDLPLPGAPGSAGGGEGGGGGDGEQPLTLRPLEVRSGAARFDLTLFLTRGEAGELAGYLEYSTDLYEAATARRLGEQLVRLLEGMTAHPDRPLAALPILGEAERRQLVETFGAARLETSPDGLPDGTLARRFRRMVERHRDRPAVTFEGETWTYGELGERVARLAARLDRALVERGVAARGARVGLAVERSPDLVVGLLAILEAGAAYLPLDPSYPPERLAFMVEDSRAPVILVGEAVGQAAEDAVDAAGDGVAESTAGPLTPFLAPFLEGAAEGAPGAPVLMPIREAESGAEAPLPAPGDLAPGEMAPDDLGPDDLAYVIYTSGSTGRPKGVEVTHGNVLRLLAATEETAARGAGGDPWFAFGPDDVWTLFHSYAFDFSVWELWGALAYGGRLVVVPRETSRSPEAFYRLLAEEGVTVLNQTPSAFGQLIRAEEELSRRGELPAGRLALREVIFGGEALDPRSLEPWFERHGDRQPRLVNMYGITETTVHVTFRPLTGSEAGAPGEAGSPIGIAIPDLSTQVTDPLLEPVPLGVPGELLVGGAGLARGYLRRPALTAQRFVPDPFSGRAGARLYRSGDLVRRLPGGGLDYRGRIDSQVKVRGFRIELGEIEAVLAEQETLEEALVVVAEPAPGDLRLVAYGVPDRRAAAPVRRLLELERQWGGEGKPGGQGQRPPALELVGGDGVGRLVLYQNRGETEFLFREVFEEESYLRHGIELAAEDGGPPVVFDVGANLGMLTLFVAERAPGAVIHAFEPIPSIFRLLEANVSLHGVHAHLYSLGLDAAPGEAEFLHYPEVSVMSGRYASPEEDREVVAAYLRREREASGETVAEEDLRDLLDQRLTVERVQAPLTTLSAVIREAGIEVIDLLKIDVEKGEEAVLAGLDPQDWPKVRQMVLEVHDIDGRLERLVGRLEAEGFEVVAEQEESLVDTPLHNLYAVRPERRARVAPAPPEPGSRPVVRVASPERLTEQLRAAVRERLPEHMVPAAFVFLEALPRTPSGKLDRRGLPQPSFGLEAAGRRRVAPRTPVEEALAEIWKDLLHVDEVGVFDDFFELGGHSLIATQLISRIRDEFGVEVTLRAFFEAPTLAALDAHITESKLAEVDDEELAALLAELEQEE